MALPQSSILGRISKFISSWPRQEHLHYTYFRDPHPCGLGEQGLGNSAAGSNQRRIFLSHEGGAHYSFENERGEKTAINSHLGQW